MSPDALVTCVPGRSISSCIDLAFRLYEHWHGQIADLAFRGHNKPACPGKLLLFFRWNVLETFDSVGE